jgi:hypothetical protein
MRKQKKSKKVKQEDPKKEGAKRHDQTMLELAWLLVVRDYQLKEKRALLQVVIER